MHVYVDMKNKIYHRKGCNCIKDINLLYYIEMDEDLSKYYAFGLKPCKQCSPFIDQFKKEEQEIKLFCLNNSIIYKIMGESLLINTYYSSWKILYNENGDLKLYHENNQKYNRYNQVDGNIIKEYHDQYDVASVTIIGYLNYIIKHDKFRETNNTKYKRYNLNSKTKRFLYKRQKKKDVKRMSNRVYNILEELEPEKMASSK